MTVKSFSGRREAELDVQDTGYVQLRVHDMPWVPGSGTLSLTPRECLALTPLLVWAGLLGAWRARPRLGL